MTDDKPMSAEEVALRKARDFADRYGLGTHATEELATALRDHAAEAVEAEREANAALAENTRLDFPDNMETSAAREALDYLAAAIRARTEGGEGDG